MRVLPFSLTALACLIISPAWAKKNPDEAATRDPHVLKLASDGEVGFLRVEKRIKGKVPKGAPVLVDIEGLDAFTRAAILQYLASSGMARLVERDVLGTERSVVPSNTGNGTPDSIRTFDLPIENVQVKAPRDEYQWQPPQFLVQLSLFKDPHRPTAGLFLGEGVEMPSKPACIAVRSIDTSTGTIAWSGLRCGPSSTDEVIDMSTELFAEAASKSGSLRYGQSVLQLPVEVLGGGTVGHLTTENILYYSLNNALAQQGCQVLDVPPGATTGDRDGGRWSYHSIPFEPVSTTLLDGWIQARYALNVHARPQNIAADRLMQQLSDMDEQLIDPDLVLKKKDSVVSVLVLDIEAIDLSSGRILSSSEISIGRDASRDMLAQVVGGVLFGGTPQAWLEVRPIPQTATAKVDRSVVRVVDGMGLVTLRPGRHSADLSLAGNKQIDAQAKFETGEYQYGVLALAAPFGSLMVTTTPEGAEVLVDGQLWGPSPIQKTIDGGEHEVLARVEGCGEKTAKTTVLIGEDNSVLLHLDGFVEAEVTPPQASISLNGEVVGTGEARVQVEYG
ncbi:MAG: PEGA domain-containing protein, partial [Proteobacteria bacterium]|nr:PEGA domain-containing protein [Pseudomonadota bacterium]